MYIQRRQSPLSLKSSDKIESRQDRQKKKEKFMKYFIYIKKKKKNHSIEKIN